MLLSLLASNMNVVAFVARESSDEDIVSTVACAVETTIDASVVLCGGST